MGIDQAEFFEFVDTLVVKSDSARKIVAAEAKAALEDGWLIFFLGSDRGRTSRRGLGGLGARVGRDIGRVKMFQTLSDDLERHELVSLEPEDVLETRQVLGVEFPVSRRGSLWLYQPL